MITFNCREGLIPQSMLVAECTTGGYWSPNPLNHHCGNESAGTLCTVNDQLLSEYALSQQLTVEILHLQPMASLTATPVP